jgi:hypothetical protein
MNDGVRLLKLLIGLSDATDFGMGVKADESVRSAALWAGLARTHGGCRAGGAVALASGAREASTLARPRKQKSRHAGARVLLWTISSSTG